MSDAIKRSIEVVPDGTKIEVVASDRLAGNVSKTLTIPADSVADTPRLRHPSGDVPAFDEVLAPFLRYHAADAIGGCNGQGTERIAVQIDHAIRDGEPGFCSREIGHVSPWCAPGGIIRADIDYFKLEIYGRQVRFSV